MGAEKPPPQFSASVIEAVCRELGETVTGAQIPNIVAPLRVNEEPLEAKNTKWKRLFNAVVAAQSRQQDGRPLIRLVSECMAPVRFAGPVDFDAARSAVNERLLLVGYEVREDGRIGRVTAAQTLGEAQRRADELRSELERRNVHPDVVAFCRAELVERNYFHAVLEGCKSVADKLRKISGHSADGSALVDATCSIGSGPIVAFNDLKTEWDRSEQIGLAMLLKGLFGTFRNTTAHAPRVQWATSMAEALDLLTLASMLHRRLDAAQTRRTVIGS